MTTPQNPRDDNCEHCGDTGLVRVYGAEDYGVSFESEACERCALGRRLACEHCDGAGWINESVDVDIPCPDCSAGVTGNA